MRWGYVVLVGLAACDGGARPAEPPAQNAQPAPGAEVPAALVVVMNAQEIFVGNDTYETDPDARYQGVSTMIMTAFDTHPPAQRLGAGSVGAVVGYNTGIDVLVPMGPVERITGAVFEQRPHRGKIGTEMVRGLTVGIDALAGVAAERRILLLIGDGHDTNDERALEVLGSLRERIEARHIELTALLAVSPISGCDEGVIAARLPGRIVCAAFGERMTDGVRDALAR